MSRSMVQRLILKDWYLRRVPISLILIGAVIGLALATLPGSTYDMIGIALIANVFIALTFYLPLTTVIGERTEKTLPFIMSLPVSAAEYTAAKILANLLLFLVPWTAIAAGVYIVFSSGPAGADLLSNGQLPLLLVGCLLFFCLILAFAIISESIGWTIAVIVGFVFVVGNVGGQVIPRLPAAQRFLAAARDWRPEFFWALGIEILLILAILATAFVQQARKRDFV